MTDSDGARRLTGFDGRGIREGDPYDQSAQKSAMA